MVVNGANQASSTARVAPDRHGPLGATPHPDGRCSFLVWAPRAQTVHVVISAPAARRIPMQTLEAGYFGVVVDDVGVGARYAFQLDDGPARPDPASRSQPDGVHAPSQVVDLGFSFAHRDFAGLPLADYILYELHVGTFSAAGTFDAVVEALPRLSALGINAIELMPVAQFPGGRNWGYDGVLPSAVQATYGGVAGLQRLVDASHGHGIAVVLDVVYNHLGPEGNYLPAFGPYFTDRYHTPWGQALNFDDAHSDEVRRYFIESALSFVRDVRVDGLRLDAIHAIFDQRALSFLEELTIAVQRIGDEQGRSVHVIAESGLNDPRLVRPRAAGGMGMDAMWSDDFHHALHSLLTDQRDGYYVDFGRVDDLSRAFCQRQTFDGRFSTYRQRRHGRPGRDVPAERFVVCAENHDQVGNRAEGDRLVHQCGLEGRKLAAAMVLLSPQMPLLFMGEEYGELAPFQYFVSHGDADLVDAVRAGRKREFAAFAWQVDVPDPQAEATFARSKLDQALRERSPHREIESYYKALIALRRSLRLDPVQASCDEAARRLDVFSADPQQVGAHWLVANFAEDTQAVLLTPPAQGAWHKRIASAANAWAGPGETLPAWIDAASPVSLPARSCVLFVRDA